MHIYNKNESRELSTFLLGSYLALLQHITWLTDKSNFTFTMLFPTSVREVSCVIPKLIFLAKKF